MFIECYTLNRDAVDNGTRLALSRYQVNEFTLINYALLNDRYDELSFFSLQPFVVVLIPMFHRPASRLSLMRLSGDQCREASAQIDNKTQHN